MVFFRIRKGIYSFNDFVSAFGHHIIATCAMLTTGVAMIAIIWTFNLTMAWYSMPELVFPIYILPMLNAAFWVHSVFADRNKVLFYLKLDLWKKCKFLGQSSRDMPLRFIDNYVVDFAFRDYVCGLCQFLFDTHPRSLPSSTWSNDFLFQQNWLF